TGKEVASQRQGWHRRSAVCFHPRDPALVLVGCDEGLIRRWKGGRLLADGRPGHRGPVNAVALFDRGRRLLSAGDAGMVRLWDGGTGRHVRRVRAHDGPAEALAVSPDGRQLATGGKDEVVRLWPLPGLGEPRELRVEFWVQALAWLGTGR